MNDRPKIFDILAACPDPAAHHALAAGLPLVDADSQCQIIDIIVARRAGRGLEALPDYFDRLAPEAQDRLVVHTAHLFAVFRLTIRSPTLQTRLNTLALIRR